MIGCCLTLRKCLLAFVIFVMLERQLPTVLANAERETRSLEKKDKSDPPSNIPSAMPTITTSPTFLPSALPSPNPSETPSQRPSYNPTKRPSRGPTKRPSRGPTNSPSRGPTNSPSRGFTYRPTRTPTQTPSFVPTTRPSTEYPTFDSIETSNPSPRQTSWPTQGPPAAGFLDDGSSEPSAIASLLPTETGAPFAMPTLLPSSSMDTDSAAVALLPLTIINFEMTPGAELNEDLFQSVVGNYLNSVILDENAEGSRLDLEFETFYSESRGQGTTTIGGTWTGSSNGAKPSAAVLRNAFDESGRVALSQALQEAGMDASISGAQFVSNPDKAVPQSIKEGQPQSSGDSINVPLLAALVSVIAVLVPGVTIFALVARRRLANKKHYKLQNDGNRSVSHLAALTPERPNYPGEEISMTPLASVGAANIPSDEREELPTEVSSSPIRGDDADNDALAIEIPSSAGEVPAVEEAPDESEDESAMSQKSDMNNNPYNVSYLNGAALGVRPPLASENSFSSLSSGASGLLDVLNDASGNNNSRSAKKPSAKLQYNSERLVRVIRSAEDRARSIDDHNC